ncbi:DUF3630 family protein [Vibrio spartinae]|uniref:DUF3630 domain-containing protein n=1 Tax=Vibrio spartinae TaxID=1918945 RepID=A0A1N6M2W3_9VIBR|nr:DUF3630 family protein [Vibrio spartinae]QMV12902.1 hypothetical protein Vspart_00105 [Vibrio spartinae]SIO93774.1 hypothetical protein VSP9026_01444 [Vibrio spartinae]
MAEFSLREYLVDSGVIILETRHFDFDSFPRLGARLMELLPAAIIEKQCDADIHTWLIDFEGTHLFLKAEHYAGVLWFEALNPTADREITDFLAHMLTKGL